MPKKEPAKELNVETEMEEYKDFILGLRRLLGTSRQSMGVPHLVPQSRTPITQSLEDSRIFDFTLRTNHNQVTFRLRRDNLYLIGYRVGDGHWLEIRHDGDPNVHLIPNSTFLSFGGSYDQLAGAAGRREAPGAAHAVEGIPVGYFALSSAIDDLATATEDKVRALKLIVVVMMISEAIRFNPILDHMVQAIGAATNAAIEGWMMDAVHNWGNFCEQVCRNPDPSGGVLRNSDFRLPPHSERLTNPFQVSLILGIILQYCVKAKKVKRETLLDDDDDRYCYAGLPLVEVFSVRIDNIDDENPGQLYGTITVNDGLTQYIYNRTRNKPESIKPGHNVKLTGPHQSIWALGSFTIDFLLTDKDIISWDDEIVKDSITWDVFTIDDTYDRPISRQVKGKWGAATVNYAVWRNAVAATVTITLQEGGENTVEVYGKVTANFKDWNNPNTTSLLFNRPKDDYIEVKRRHHIPLLKSVVAVPLESSLKITASLYDYDPITADDKIAIGTVEFRAQLSGTSSTRIDGEDGNWVTVTVSWGNINTSSAADKADRGNRPPIHDEL